MSKPLRQIVETSKTKALRYMEKSRESQQKATKQMRTGSRRDFFAGRNTWDKRQKGQDLAGKVLAQNMSRNEETEQLDEVKVKRKLVSQRANIKTQGDINREKVAKNRTLRAAVKSMKETGVKPQIGTKGNQRSWKAARKSAVTEEQINEADAISLTVPLFIRMLEYAKEDAKTDMDLHKATERLMDIDGIVDMDSYENIVGK